MSAAAGTELQTHFWELCGVVSIPSFFYLRGDRTLLTCSDLLVSRGCNYKASAFMFASKNEVSIKIAGKTKEYRCQAKSNPSNLSMGSERIKRSTALGMK